MLPGPGATGKAPFNNEPAVKQRLWLQRLYKIMERTRTRSDAGKVDAAIVAANLPADSMTGPFTPILRDVENKDTQIKLEKLGVVLRTFPNTRSPASTENVPPSAAQASALTSLLDEVEKCYAEIAAGKADQHIKDVFSAGSLTQVRDVFSRAAGTAKNVKQVLAAKNPSTDSKPQIFIDVSGELPMKHVHALSAPSMMILPSSLADPDPAKRTDGVGLLLHECMHVLSEKIIDHAYWPDSSFTTMGSAKKITNADHFARVAKLYKKMDTPLPSGGDDLYKNIPKPEDKQLISVALGLARSKALAAWGYSLDAWNVLRRLTDDPAYYDHLGSKWQELTTNMNLISQISHMTLHERVPAKGARLCTVTGFDLALLEETIMDLAGLIRWSRTRKEIQLVAAYPDTTEIGVLYVLTEALSKESNSGVLADSFLKHGFSCFNQKEVWLQCESLIANITSMISNQGSFRSLPDKPKKA
ncbi:MAG TPA: hypothetical protein VGD53_10210 [Actinoallomurus sp.]|jgi:hypothetical protein